LYSRSLIEGFSRDLSSNLFGNPHSASPSSTLSTNRVDRVRSRVLRFFKADPEHFDIVFVANATAAIKLVMQAFEDYPATKGKGAFWYGYHYDAHTSLVGVWQAAQLGGKCFCSDSEVENWLQDVLNPDESAFFKSRSPNLGLFAYPAQSNLNGHRPPLTWPGRIRSSPHPMHRNVYTLLDAASYVTTAQLDLSNPDTSPDFTALSFYKIFGFPNLGALIVRKAAGHILRHRRYFGGGTVEMVIAIDATWHAKKTQLLHDELEDGTLPFHNVIALDSALDVHERLFGSMARISAHTCYLSGALYSELSSIRHGNGLPLCEIYKHPESTYGNSKTQGPIIAFNVRNSQGGWVGKSNVEKLANARGIELRTGGVCNPGGIATYLDLRSWELRRNYAEGMRCGGDFDILAGKPTGVVRVSLGAMSSMKDVETFLRFMREIFMESMPKPQRTLVPRNASVTHFKVQSITIFPIEGCKGWRVPSSITWEINQEGLKLDGEWCIYDTIKQEPLATEMHPRLRLLQPTIGVVNGVLTIRTKPPSRKANNIKQEVTISYWENPPNSKEYESAFKTALDVYDSRSLANFFTSFMGFPCTLARYPRSRVSSAQHKTSHDLTRKSLPGQKITGKSHNSLPISTLRIENSLKISTCATRNVKAHISIASTDSSLPSGTAWRPWEYVRVGPHYLQNLDPLSTAEVRHVRHLLTYSDLLVEPQYPNIYEGQTVEIFSFVSAAEDEILRACIASLSRAKFICPAAACRKDFQSREKLHAHFLAHGEILKTVVADGEETGHDNTELLELLELGSRVHGINLSVDPQPVAGLTNQL